MQKILNVLGWFICTHCLRCGDWLTYKSNVHKNKETHVPIPKTFEDGKYFENIVNNLMHFKTLTTEHKISILKSLNMEVIIL